MKHPPLGNHRAGKALQGLLFAGFALSPVVLPAADRTWDGTTGSFGTNTNWSDDITPTAGDNAIISNGGTAQVTTGDNFSVSRLFISGHSGTGNLSISGGTLSASGTPHNMYIGGDDNNGGSGVGSVTISGGTLAGSNGELLFGSRGGTGNLTMTGGTLSNNNWIIFGRDGGGTGNANLSGNATITKTGGGNIALGVFSGTTNTITMSDNASMTSNNEIRIGWGNNSADTRGVINMSGDSSIGAGGTLAIAVREGGGTAGPTGELHMSSSSIATAGNEFYVGSGNSGVGATGILTMTDNSSVAVTNGFVVGRFNSTGTATVGGNAEIAVGGFNVIGDGATSNGTLVVNGNAHVHSNRQLWLNLNGSTSTVTINGGRVVAHAVLTGDPVDASGAGVSFGRFGSGGSGTINLNGGVLETPGFSKYTGTAQINLNGGTIKATGMTTTGSFFDNIGDAEINVQAGGAKFDTNGNDITVTQNLAGVGGLTKLGAGSLTLTGASAYTGATVISAGTLTLGGSDRIANASALTLAGGTLNLNNFNETLAALTLDGDSSIDFGALAGANGVSFANSSALDWVGILTLQNFELGSDSINFAGAGLTADQLSRIQLLVGGTLYQGSGFEGNAVIFTAVPEPADIGLAIGGALTVLAFHRARNRRRVA